MSTHPSSYASRISGTRQSEARFQIAGRSSRPRYPALRCIKERWDQPVLGCEVPCNASGTSVTLIRRSWACLHQYPRGHQYSYHRLAAPIVPHRQTLVVGADLGCVMSSLMSIDSSPSAAASPTASRTGSEAASAPDRHQLLLKLISDELADYHEALQREREARGRLEHKNARNERQIAELYAHINHCHADNWQLRNELGTLQRCVSDPPTRSPTRMLTGNRNAGARSERRWPSPADRSIDRCTRFANSSHRS